MIGCERRFPRICALVMVACLISCGACEQGPDLTPVVIEKTEEEGWVRLTLGGRQARLQVAATRETRGRGLMGRRKLGEDEGMIFIYPDSRFMSFWMQNTYIPLSIAFIKEDGRIIRISQMKPMTEEPSYTSGDRCRYAVEMAQGWFEMHGIRAGDVIEIPESVRCIEAEE